MIPMKTRLTSWPNDGNGAGPYVKKTFEHFIRIEQNN